MKDSKNQNGMKLPDSTASEKRQTRFMFTCVANILYLIPSLMSLGISIMYEGVTPGGILGIITSVLAVPFALFVMRLYKKKSGRRTAVLCAAGMIVLHLVCAAFLRGWYIIMSPAMILDALMIAWSDVIENH